MRDGRGSSPATAAWLRLLPSGSGPLVRRPSGVVHERQRRDVLAIHHAAFSKRVSLAKTNGSASLVSGFL